MEEYLEGAIRHAIWRGEYLLSLIPSDLSREFHALAQKCTDEITKNISGLRKTLNDRDPGRLAAKHRSYCRAARILDEYELLAISALSRSDKSDRRITRLIDKIRLEIRHPLPVSPAVASLSPDYFEMYADLNLLRVPLSAENFLLHLPDLYHELAHPLLVQENMYPQVKPFKRALLQSYMGVSAYLHSEIEKSEYRRETDAFRYPLRVWEKCWAEGWLVEFLCDLYATCTVGPAFGWAHLHLCAKRSETLFRVPSYVPSSHPSDNARMEVILMALGHIGFSREAEEIQDRWSNLVDLHGEAAEPEYRLCYPRSLLMEIMDEAFKAIRDMKVRIAFPDTTDFVHTVMNQAWKEFWRDPAAYVEWEKQAVGRLREHCSRIAD